MAAKQPYARLTSFEPETGGLRVVIDTHEGSRNKFVLDEGLGLFKLGGVIPAGGPER